MADRVDYYYRQRVTEAELDLAFDLLEKADRDLAADLKIHGIISGAVPSQHSPVPNLSIDLTAPGRAYDRLGQRIFYGVGQNVDCSVDLLGVSTAVSTPGNERWLGVFLRFKRLLSDPRTDGNSQQVLFRRDESFEIVVRQGPDAVIGAAPKVALEPDELLICDVRRRQGQTQILDADIDITRRQAFVFAQGSQIGLETNAWTILSPVAATVQSALDEVDSELSDHFSGGTRRHAASAINFTPTGFIAASNVQGAINELVSDLASQATSGSGATRIGHRSISSGGLSVSAGTVAAQLGDLLTHINDHVTQATGAHHASAITADPQAGILSTTNVQSQIAELISALASTSSVSGARRIGVADVDGRYNAGDVEEALREIAGAFDDGHFRANEANAGNHRAIIQPAFPANGGLALVWDSMGVVSSNFPSRFRLYIDTNGSLWLLFNAFWNGTAWEKDSVGFNSGGMRISRNDFELMYDQGIASTFSTFGRRWTLDMGSREGVFTSSGDVQETGYIGMEFTNTGNVTQVVSGGGGTTFRTRFSVVPTSVTFFTSSQSTNWGGLPQLDDVNEIGFGFFSVQFAVPAGETRYWFGTYFAQ